MKRLYPYLFIALGLLHSLSSCTSKKEKGDLTPPKTAITILPIKGKMAERSAEISGMAWFGDYLIFLPQYPNFPAKDGNGRLFALKKSTLLAHLATGKPDTLAPIEITVRAPDLTHIEGFEGYEAIIFTQPDSGDAVLSIEINLKNGTPYSYLVKGQLKENFSAFIIDTTSMVKVESQSKLGNMTEETLVLLPEATPHFLCIHEANGVKKQSRDPFTHRFDQNLSLASSPVIHPIPFRITDATEVDAENRFWVLNTFYPNDKELRVKKDGVAKRFGYGKAHKKSNRVERLLELEYKNEAIRLTDTPPIWLELDPEKKVSRNWEGIVRLDSHGFLIISDKHPASIFAFVPFQN